MSKVIDISTYSSSYTDSYYLDTNVWLYLFCPLGNYQNNLQKKYSAFFKTITSSNRTIILTYPVVSEFSNRWLRIDFELWKKSSGNTTADYKKDFVRTSRFQQTVADIRTVLNSMLKVSIRHSDEFNSIDINQILTDFGSVDFNDAYYIKQALDKKWKIVTHDSDIINTHHPVEVITANI